MPGSSGGLAAAWSQLATLLAAPAVLGGGVMLLCALLILQVTGSAFLLAGKGREKPR